MMEIREIEVTKLKPWEDNPRINDHVVEKLVKSIETFGFNVPILHDQNFTIIAGHTRWKTALKLGMTHVPAIMLTMDDANRKAFALADNKLGSLAYWDDELVTKVLEELKTEDVDLSAIGYSDAEMEALLAPYREFNWKEFEDYLTKKFELDFAVLQLKVKQEVKERLLTSIRQYAQECGIEAKDSAHLAGQVLCRLLGVEP
jgi:ParB-like chromosome segregation protein Spo0J